MRSATYLWLTYGLELLTNLLLPISVTLMLLFPWQEGHPACKKSYCNNSPKFTVNGPRPAYPAVSLEN